MKRNLIYILVLLFVTAIPYLPILDADFINYDDGFFVTENAHVQSGINSESIAWAFTETGKANWHPVTWISHILDYEIYGMDAKGHHLTNLLLHLTGTVLIFVFFNLATNSSWKSFLIAVLFGIHPLHVESVAWIAERRDVLSGVFFATTLLAYFHYVKNPGLWRYLVLALSFLLGLMSKSMLVTLPFLLLLLDYWPLNRFGFQDFAPAEKPGSRPAKERRTRRYLFVWEKLPLVVISAGFCWLALYTQKTIGSVSDVAESPIGFRIANAIVAYATYIRKMIWPGKLAIVYPLAELATWQVVGAALLLVCLSAWFIALGKRYPFLPVGWGWFLGTLVPVIGLVPIGHISMADRYTYIPLTGLFVILAWGIPVLAGEGRYRKAVLAGLAILAISALSARTWFYVQNWKNSVSLFENALEVTSNNYVAHNNLATALAAKGDIGGSIVHLKRSLEILPSQEEARVNLGIMLSLQGRNAEAVEQLEEVLKIYPDSERAHYNLGLVLARENLVDQAIYQFLETVRIHPENDSAHFNLGVLLLRLNRNEEAYYHFSKALEINPRHPKARKFKENTYRLLHGPAQ